jgi:AdoMet-dependent heme synthase
MKFEVDFERAPLLLIWEVTRSCELSCKHCRAEAINQRDPRELSLEEGKHLVDDVAAMGTPLMIFTGGDPLQRDDLEDLIAHAKSKGLRVGTIPATTGRLTRERVASLKAAGVDQMALSLDGPDAATHDAFRRVEGSFDKAMEGAAWARELDVPLQVNTVFGAWNVHQFDEMVALVESLGLVFWEVFFLVPTGRGVELESCSAEQFEELFAKLHALSRRAKYIVKITEGQHFRRYVAEAVRAQPASSAGRGHPMGAHSDKPAVNAGKGFCFVDHIGNVCPSGFLPLPCGNVRATSVIDIYRDHPVFRELRDDSLLKGKCARCRYRRICGGGSRARAYAMTGDYFAPEPFCAYDG